METVSSDGKTLVSDSEWEGIASMIFSRECALNYARNQEMRNSIESQIKELKARQAGCRVRTYEEKRQMRQEGYFV